MASIGRGRGWAKAVDHETALRRPGQSESPKTSELDEIIDRICHVMEISDSANDSLDGLVSFINCHQDKPSPENFDKYWKEVQDNLCFGIKFLNLYLAKDSKMNHSMKRTIYNQLQVHYDERDELHKENPSRFKNITWMLGIVSTYQKQSMTNYQGIFHLSFLHCLNLLFDTSTEDNMETVAIQLYERGKCIWEYLTNDRFQDKPDRKSISDELSKIVNKARHLLVNRNMSSRSRAHLLLIIDLANQEYRPFTGDLKTFYVTALEPSHAPPTNTILLFDRDFDQQLYLYEILRNGTFSRPSTNKTVKKKQPEKPAQKQVNQSEGTTGPVPRAIRGSGASDSSKDNRNEKKSSRGHKEKLTDEQVWSAKQNTGSKVWGHDDRFDNDYE